jgi:hypothetical protein
VADAVHVAEGGLRPGVVLRGGFLIPAHRLDRVLDDAVAVRIDLAEGELGLGIALFRALRDLSEGRLGACGADTDQPQSNQGAQRQE